MYDHLNKRVYCLVTGSPPIEICSGIVKSLSSDEVYVATSEYGEIWAKDTHVYIDEHEAELAAVLFGAKSCFAHGRCSYLTRE